MLQIGGEGVVVEIDETSLKKKPKYNRGQRHQDCWLFGGVERESGKWFGVLVHNDRTKTKLLPLIKKHVRQGTVTSSSYCSTYDMCRFATHTCVIFFYLNVP